MKTWRSNK